MVLVPDTFFSLSDLSLPAGGKKPQSTSLLVQCIMDEFEGVPIEPVMRRYWSDNAGSSMLISLRCLTHLLSCTGLEFINQLMVEDDERAATLVAVSNK